MFRLINIPRPYNTLQERIDVYERALEYYEKKAVSEFKKNLHYYSFCPLIEQLIGYWPNLEIEFPELFKFKPNKNLWYWFERDLYGIGCRKSVLHKAIKHAKKLQQNDKSNNDKSA